MVKATRVHAGGMEFELGESVASILTINILILKKSTKILVTTIYSTSINATVMILPNTHVT